MTRKVIAIAGLMAGMTAAAWLAAAPVSGQTAGTTGARSATAGKAVPRTPWGTPDLSGVWTGASLTRLQRPEAVKDREFYTDQEIADMEKRAADTQFDPDPVDANGRPTRQDGVGGYDPQFEDGGIKVDPSKRTSLIIDPKNGRVPFTDAARKLQRPYGKPPYDSYLDLDTGERCLGDGTTGLVWFSYNPNHQIVHTRDYLMILHEMYAERRLIPLDGRAHLPDSIPQWSGNSRARWEGDTLVVETKNFEDKFERFRWAEIWRAPTATLNMLERFTRIDAENMVYRVTITDPSKFTQPWTIETTLTTNQASRGIAVGPPLEYACHEGNVGGPGILAGQREVEKKAAGRP